MAAHLGILANNSSLKRCSSHFQSGMAMHFFTFRVSKEILATMVNASARAGASFHRFMMTARRSS
eukprot:5620713-Lingulodinium_polyedra.AAC.1